MAVVGSPRKLRSPRVNQSRINDILVAVRDRQIIVRP